MRYSFAVTHLISTPFYDMASHSSIDCSFSDTSIPGMPTFKGFPAYQRLYINQNTRLYSLHREADSALHTGPGNRHALH